MSELMDHLTGREDWRFACPACRATLGEMADGLQCANCNRSFRCENAIWQFLDGPRLRHYDRFLREYQTVRRREGWGSDRAEYYRSLPHVAADDPQRDIWRRRETSFRTLLDRVVTPTTLQCGRPLRVVDAGAGNSWLSHRLSQLGHQVLAVDLSIDGTDGLNAWRFYDVAPAWTAVQAEFDRLPLASGQVDLLVFNASLHYSASCEQTASEALRVLRPGGAVVVMDSPLYRNAASGNMMVTEREETFQQKYGFRSNSMSSEHFLTYRRLRELGEKLDLNWQFFWTEAPLHSTLRRWWLRTRGHREAATMPVIVGARDRRQGEHAT